MEIYRIKDSNIPIDLVRSIMKCLDIFFVVVLIEGLYFPCITLLGPSGQGGQILLMEKQQSTAYEMCNLKTWLGFKLKQDTFFT